MPSAGDTKLEAPKDEIQDAPDLNEPARGDGRVTSYDQVAGPNSDFGVPSMEEINIKPAEGPYRGGETLALEALEAYMADKKNLKLKSSQAIKELHFSAQLLRNCYTCLCHDKTSTRLKGVGARTV